MSLRSNLSAKSLAVGAAALALTAVAGAAQAASTIVNVSGVVSEGTVVNLAAGTYTLNFIDVAQGGLYGGYSPWSVSTGCDGAGMNCATGFTMSMGIDFGHGVGSFNRIDGYQHGTMVSPGNNNIYETGAQALASALTTPFYRAPLTNYTDLNAYTLVASPISFTLAAAQSVNFFIIDNPYSDNRGGLSLRLTTPDLNVPGGVPEPATWALMIGGFGLAGATLRRRRVAVA
jgi:hypothetical protein